MRSGKPVLRPVVFLGVLALLLCLPQRALAVIYEYADPEGRVTHYKYTNSKGTIVFADSLNAIPPESRAKQKIVRVGPPAPKPASPAPPAPEPVPAPAPAPAAVQPPFPVPAPPPPEETGSVLPAVLAVLLLAAAAVVVVVLVKRRGAVPARGGRGSRAPAREPERPPRERVETRSPAERMQETLQHHLQTGDFLSAASLCEAQGDLGRAAGYYREAGVFPKAGELYAAQKDYRRAAEAYERAGEHLRAAELYEAAFQREGGEVRGGASSENAVKSGAMYAAAGQTERALGIYLKAKLFAQAAPLAEQRQDFLQAADLYAKAGDAEKAAACCERGGDPKKSNALLANVYYDKGMLREAAACAEKAGDAARAAEILQEAREYGKAGELFCRAGLFDEAAESFVLANDRAGAAAAFEQAGKYLLAAKAREALGTEPERTAQLFEKAEDFHAAGKYYLKVGDLDRALNALQRVDPASENGRGAALWIGMIFLKKGMVGLAQEKFLKLIDGQPIGKANLDPYYFLALCHEKNGETGKAKEIFSKILIEDFTFRDVKRRLERSDSGKTAP